jgi:DNA-binding transcriptional LysR family regulator
MIDVGKLQTLRVVIDRGSFSAAGHTLGLTQPAVSRQVSLLERQLGTQLVRRTQQGVLATEAGRLLAEHATAILGRLAMAEAQIADLVGLRSGHIRLGSFLTALVHLSSELAALLETRHPDLFANQRDVIEDELVDRRTALRRLAAGELDVAIVFEHAFEPDPPADDVEIVRLFDDQPRIMLPAAHPLAGATAVTVSQLASDTWICAHQGSAARLVDHVLRRAGLQPSIIRAGHGDEPLEAQALIASGHGVTVAHELNVLLNPDHIATVALAGQAPVRHIQAAIMRHQHSAAPRAVIDALIEIGRRRRALHD